MTPDPTATPTDSATAARCTQPLLGIRVLDLTRLLPGPVATLRLAQMGASVIKIEEPGIGDYARLMGPVRHSVSQFFVAVNHGKAFLRLDFKQSADVAQFLQMVKDADVVIESFRPGVMDRLGLGWQVLKQHNPKLVMCAISGYGQDGPFANLAGHDINYIGYAGMLQQNSVADGLPALPNLQIGDLLGGAQTALQGILAALLAVKMGGDGCFVDVSMTDAVLANNFMPLASWNTYGKIADPGRDLLTGGAPCYNVYATRDQRHLAVGALELKFWQHMCGVLQRPDLKMRHWMCGLALNSDDSNALKAELALIFGAHDLAHWRALFANEDCCVTPILRLDEALSHPLFAARQMVQQAQHETEGEYCQLGSGIRFVP
jgi:crotonobetainyl-CoA:carnitine CoA-transferase CaiB-like acyl-CoA transferase